MATALRFIVHTADDYTASDDQCEWRIDHAAAGPDTYSASWSTAAVGAGAGGAERRHTAYNHYAVGSCGVATAAAPAAAATAYSGAAKAGPAAAFGHLDEHSGRTATAADQPNHNSAHSSSAGYPTAAADEPATADYGAGSAAATNPAGATEAGTFPFGKLLCILL